MIQEAKKKKTIVIYGTKEYNQFFENANNDSYHDDEIECYPETILFEDIKSAVDKCSRVYLYGVGTDIQNELILYCTAKKKDIYVSQDIDELNIDIFDKVHTIESSVKTKKKKKRLGYRFVKRAFDIIVSLLALIVLSPVFLVVAIAIKLYDGGPVLYKQIRLTKGYREFKIYKFRSMVVNAEKDGARLSTRNDDRITPIGKTLRRTRIDELPQFVNVLKGDMSLIGPRPERPELEKEIREYLPEFSLRLQVPAGLSGYAQVYGKYNTPPADKLKLDLVYINKRSLFLDFKLILFTIGVLFSSESSEGI